MSKAKELLNEVGSAPDSIFLDNPSESVQALEEILKVSKELLEIFKKEKDLKARSVGMGIRDIMNALVDLLHSVGDEKVAQAISNIKGAI